MVKKQKNTSDEKEASGGAGLFDSELAGAVKASAQQIWLAGMGAFSKAQAEGTKVFESLVHEGTNLQRKTQSAAEETLGEVSGRMSAMADTVTAKAGQNWDRLETIFEQRTAKALAKLGVPSAKDVQALAERVDALTAAVARLSKPAPAKAARKSAAMPAAHRAAKPSGKAATKALTRRAPRKGAAG